MTVEGAADLTNAIRRGNDADVRELLAAEPELATARIHGSRTALHVATDWPGYSPNGPEIVDLLIQGGADPDVGSDGTRAGETPLHWAASTDDVDVADVLIRAGASVDAADGSIGTPLETRSAADAGTWPAAWSTPTQPSASCGTPPHSASSPDSTNSSPPSRRRLPTR